MKLISETMPLNEWPLVTLKHLLVDLMVADEHWKTRDHISTTTKEIIDAVEMAIKDATERESKLPY